VGPGDAYPHGISKVSTESGQSHSDFFWVIGFRSFVLRPTANYNCGTQKISLGKANRLHDHPVANTPHSSRGYWGSSLSADLPAAERLTALHFRSERPCTYGFHQTLPHGLLGPNLDDESLPVLRHSALASLVSGSLREGPGSGFVRHELTSGLLVMPVAHSEASLPPLAVIHYSVGSAPWHRPLIPKEARTWLDGGFSTGC
jgi:hypothetical protein